MPVKMSDVAQHVQGNRSLRGSVETLVESVISSFRGVNSAEANEAAIADLEANKAQLVDACFSNVDGGGMQRRLGPGETPTIQGDHNAQLAAMSPAARADRAESMGNPVLPRDASGHKVHPADAFSGTGQVPADRTATSFGGTGAGVDASNRSQAALDASNMPANSQQATQQGQQGKLAEYRANAQRGIEAQRARDNAAAKNGPAV